MKSGKKKALVTGASRGIGLATAQSLAQAGWVSGLCARSLDSLESLQKTIETGGGEAPIFQCDLGSQEDLGTTALRVFGQWDALDLLVCNAGVGIFKPFQEINALDWERVMEINLRGTTFLIQKLIPLLQKAPCPRLILVTSDVARRTFSHGSLYCMSKYAQDALALTLRKELRPLGIRVSVVMPGLTDTSFGGGEEGAAHKAEWLRAQDVARAIQFIAESPPHVVIDELMIHPFCQDYQL